MFADAPGFLDGNIGGFAQATDDARAVINYMHSWPVPVDFATPVPCTPTDLITYDVSISEQSGLQVPKNYVSGTEREFVVTVSNAGDAATGNVVVTGVLASGAVVPAPRGNLTSLNSRTARARPTPSSSALRFKGRTLSNGAQLSMPRMTRVLPTIVPPRRAASGQVVAAAGATVHKLLRL